MTEESSVGSIEEVRAKALAELEAADSLESLEDWRVTYLGRRGQLTQILRGLGSLSPEDRREVGASANQLKNLLEDSLASREDAIKSSGAADGQDAIDVTLPGWPMPLGGLHPSTIIIRQICDVFASMGFQVVESGLEAPGTGPKLL